MELNLCAIYDVFLNFNNKPCKHYNKIFKPFYLTCKTLVKILEKTKVFNCDICCYREIICNECITNNTKSCYYCKCKGHCKTNANLTGIFPNSDGYCITCKFWYPKLTRSSFGSVWSISVNRFGDWPETISVITFPTLKPLNFNNTTGILGKTDEA